LHSFELEGVEEVLINGEKDTIIEWDILPNRSSDCLCYMGMAKEIGAVLNMQAKTFSAEGLMTTEFDKNLKTSDFLTLDISDKNLVKRAAKRLAVNVNVAPSPQ
jgi:phenylalanyl-tRNA synthetase beta subunit